MLAGLQASHSCVLYKLPDYRQCFSLIAFRLNSVFTDTKVTPDFHWRYRTERSAWCHMQIKAECRNREIPGKKKGEKKIHSTMLYLFSRLWHQRTISIREYLHMVQTSGDALSKTRLYGQDIGNIHLFFYVKLFPSSLNFIAKSLQDDTRNEISWDPSTNQAIHNLKEWARLSSTVSQ